MNITTGYHKETGQGRSRCRYIEPVSGEADAARDEYHIGVRLRHTELKLDTRPEPFRGGSVDYPALRLTCLVKSDCRFSFILLADT